MKPPENTLEPPTQTDFMETLKTIIPYLLVLILIAGFLFSNFGISFKKPFIGQTEPKNLGRLFMILGVTITLILIFILANPPPSVRASKITEGDPITRVEELIGKGILEKETETMKLYSYNGNFASAGPIRVGFNSENKAIYLKIWEDDPPEFNSGNIK